MSYQKHQESQPEQPDGLGEESAKKKDQNKNPQLHAQSHTLHPDRDKRQLVSYFSNNVMY